MHERQMAVGLKLNKNNLTIGIYNKIWLCAMEIEKRKNQHINDLIKNHNKAFHQMKCYYNDITSGNLQLIKSLSEAS